MNEIDELYNLLEFLNGGNFGSLEPGVFSEIVHWVEKKSDTTFLTPEELKVKLEIIPLEKRISLVSQLKEMAEEMKRPKPDINLTVDC